MRSKLTREGLFKRPRRTIAQHGDTSLPIHLYNGEELAAIFRNAYLSISEFDTEEVQIFEAIACLRWLLLNRIAEVPKNEKTIERVNDIIIEKNI
jgi:hypothetical protein